jgi:hypothetical protein
LIVTNGNAIGGGEAEVANTKESHGYGFESKCQYRMLTQRQVPKMILIKPILIYDNADDHNAHANSINNNHLSVGDSSCDNDKGKGKGKRAQRAPRWLELTAPSMPSLRVPVTPSVDESSPLTVQVLSCYQHFAIAFFGFWSFYSLGLVWYGMVWYGMNGWWLHGME